MSDQPVTDAEDLVERAIESVLDQVPEVVDEEPEGSAKLQPWAETAAPPSKNKRPLSELLEQYAARVAADPEAVAGRPRGQHPIAAFFARFTPVGAGRGGDSGAGGARGRRRRGKRGAADGRGAVAQPAAAAPQGGGRSRRGGRPQGGRPQGGRPQGEQRQQARPASAQPAAPNAQGGEQRRSRRRGRRRGRGGGASGGGSQPAGA